MPRVSAAFFMAGAIYVGLGMFWGMQMGASENFAMAPAHAHLNLLGWVTMALYGTFYALTAATYSPKLAWTQFVIQVTGVAIMIPSLATVLDNSRDYLMPLVISEVMMVISLLIFLVSVFKELTRAR